MQAIKIELSADSVGASADSRSDVTSDDHSTTTISEETRRLIGEIIFPPWRGGSRDTVAERFTRTQAEPAVHVGHRLDVRELIGQIINPPRNAWIQQKD